MPLLSYTHRIGKFVICTFSLPMLVPLWSVSRNSLIYWNARRNSNVITGHVHSGIVPKNSPERLCAKWIEAFSKMEQLVEWNKVTWLSGVHNWRNWRVIEAELVVMMWSTAMGSSILGSTASRWPAASISNLPDANTAMKIWDTGDVYWTSDNRSLSIEREVDSEA